MSRKKRVISSILLAAVLFSPVVFCGCAARASYRVYDPATGTTTCGIKTKLSPTNVGKSKPTATIVITKSDTLMSRRNTGTGGTRGMTITARNRATG